MLLPQANPQMTLFTGSSRVADKLATDLKGRIKLEDAGFDWKVLGPDVQEVSFRQFITLDYAIFSYRFKIIVDLFLLIFEW